MKTMNEITNVEVAEEMAYAENTSRVRYRVAEIMSQIALDYLRQGADPDELVGVGQMRDDVHNYISPEMLKHYNDDTQQEARPASHVLFREPNTPAGQAADDTLEDVMHFRTEEASEGEKPVKVHDTSIGHIPFEAARVAREAKESGNKASDEARKKAEQRIKKREDTIRAGEEAMRKSRW